jgi:hypothetical protein
MTGLEGAPLLSIARGDISSIVSPITTGEVPLTEANLLSHEAVVEVLMEDRTVPPVRFGTVLLDEEEVRAVLVAHYSSFVASLERVRGHVEVDVRVLWDGASLSPPRRGPEEGWATDSGRAYMLARLEEERRIHTVRKMAEALATELHVPLSRLAKESTRKVLVSPGMLLAAAYLVPREQVGIFRQAVEGLISTYPRFRFLCTGPWPPYSFATQAVPIGRRGVHHVGS